MPATIRVVQIDPAPMPTLTASMPSPISASVASAVATLPAIELHVRILAAQPLHHVEHALRVAVRRIDDEQVDVRRDQRFGPFERVTADADGRSDPQAPERVLARVRVLDHLLDVLDGDQPLEHELIVDDQQLLDLVPVQELARLFERRAHRHGEQRIARHDVGDRPIQVRLEAQVAVGQDADQLAFLAAVGGDRHARDAVLPHQVEGLEDPVGRRQRDRVDDHPALGALDAIHLRRLFLDREVLVDDADATLLGHGDCQPRLGDGIHRRAEQRHVDGNVARHPRPHVDGARQHRRVPWHQQHVVEGQGGGETDRDLIGAQDIGTSFHLPLKNKRAATVVAALGLSSLFCRTWHCRTLHRRTFRPRGTSCISCRCRTDRDRSARPSALPA